MKTLLLGKLLVLIQATGTGNFKFQYNVSETPAGALNINTSTGELTVADETLYLILKQTQVCTAVISVSNSRKYSNGNSYY